MRRKFISWLVLVTMLVSMVMPVGAMAATIVPTQVFDVSKSKTATALDENDQSEVTLAIPSAEEKLATDIVFVIDGSEGIDEFMAQAKSMMDEIQGKMDEDAELNVGIVIFSGNTSTLMSLQKYDSKKFENAVNSAYLTSLFMQRGSNSAAGILAARNMLAESDTDPSRQNMIVISDFASYVYTNNEDAGTFYSRTSGVMNNDGSLYEWTSKYSALGDTNAITGEGLNLPEAYKNGTYEEWSEYMAWIEANRDQWVKDDQVYNRTIFKRTAGLTKPDPIYDAATMANYVCNVEEALWQTAHYYKQMVDAGINCYAISAEQHTDRFSYTFGRNYMSQLGKSETEMPAIMNDIIYAVGAGSSIEDEIGSDFDFVNDIDSFNLTVNDEVLDKEEMTTNRYGFGKTDDGYRFELEYIPGDENQVEKFNLLINENISNFEPVQFNYQVKLVNKAKKSGIYGQLDLDGDGIIDDTITDENPNGVAVDEEKAVYTNNSATLYPVNSNGVPGVEETFGKPSVTYEVKRSGGGGSTTSVILQYESNGGTTYPNEPYYTGTVVELDKVPFRSGYEFTGWYADSDLTEKITSVTMDSNKTVYAGWEASLVPPDLNGDDHFAYVVGYPDGTVQPQGNITRAEVAAIFFRLLKEDVRDTNLTFNNPFVDMEENAWYTSSVSTLSKLNIIKGMTDTSFAPNAPITRAQFAAICARFDTGKTEGSSNFSDLEGHWAKAEIERAVSLGWIAGYEDGTFRPDQPITRAEAMTIINRVLVRIPENADDLLNDMNKWVDNQPGTWYYLAVQEATNSHDYEMKNDINESWTKLNEDPDWSRYNVQ